ncbi:cholesterol 25-hydroxylase-like [Nerophis ophidion]|uniref:cholesterol 25-hydroxylase-like n=1 Tax=Nerophis ophidion TaxID=159077 RepID=UPI002AE0AF75|nr:cholesterol 25-hydroxylase-like [Nerophis ophidion]
MNTSSTQRVEPLLQSPWDYLRIQHQHVLSSFYLPACGAFLVHVAFCAPFLLLDVLAGVSPRVHAWRISAGPPPSLSRWSACLRRIAVRYLTAVLPVTALLQTLRVPAELPERAPTCWRLFAEVVACLLLFDAFFFAWHFCMHRVPWLYCNIHQEHHRHHKPFALQAQDASTPELLSLLLLGLASAWLVDCHPLSQVLFHLLNTWLAVEDHSGYSLPWGLHKLLPLLGGSPHHHTHHARHHGNYAPYFTHWDRLFGTYSGD